MFGLGTPEILMIVAALFLLFGATRLPQLAKSLGATRKAFKDGMKEAEDEEKMENAAKQMNGISPSQVSGISDEQLAEEMRKRMAEKQIS
jgi:sec-independent protein translocase protein TatA